MKNVSPSKIGEGQQVIQWQCSLLSLNKAFNMLLLCGVVVVEFVCCCCSSVVYIQRKSLPSTNLILVVQISVTSYILVVISISMIHDAFLSFSQLSVFFSFSIFSVANAVHPHACLLRSYSCAVCVRRCSSVVHIQRKFLPSTNLILVVQISVTSYMSVVISTSMIHDAFSLFQLAKCLTNSATKHERLILKINKNQCSKFIKQYETLDSQEATFDIITEFISCIFFTEYKFNNKYVSLHRVGNFSNNYYELFNEQL